MGEKQVKSKQRVADHGEVFTAQREVNAMLDMVKNETERIESRFLEPACGDGNFLAEILRRKLAVVQKKYGGPQKRADYEMWSVIAVMNIYGVELLPDNAAACRDRLFHIWDEAYTANCKNDTAEECREAVRYILERNILCGDALTMLQGDGTPIIFSEWSLVTGTQIKRRDFRLDVLLKENADETNYETQMTLFSGMADSQDYWMIDPVTHDPIPKPLKEYPLTDYRRIHCYG